MRTAICQVLNEHRRTQRGACGRAGGSGEGWGRVERPDLGLSKLGMIEIQGFEI
jgi:hypothetical protein